MIARETRVNDVVFLFLALGGRRIVQRSGISGEVVQQGHLSQLHPFSMSRLRCRLTLTPYLNWFQFQKLLVAFPSCASSSAAIRTSFSNLI